MIKLIFNILLLSIVSIAFHLSNASTNKLYFRNIRVQDGLPGSTITSFAQDSLGFLWIGTNEGLCRYDGSEFRVYRHNPNDPHTISNNYITNLLIDARGNLWVMTSVGLNYFDIRQHTITRIGADINTGLLADNSPTGVIESPDGTIFVSSYYSGISIKTPQSQTFTYLNTASSPNSRLNSNLITCMQLIKDSILYIAYRDRNIDCYNIFTKKNSPIQIKNRDNFSLGHIRSMANDSDKWLWIASENGLFKYDIEKGTLRDFSELKELSEDEINSVLPDNEGNLWVGTQNNGLVILNKYDLNANIKNVRPTHYKPGYLPGEFSYRTIIALFQDVSGNVWLGTHGDGINFAENDEHRFKHLKHEPSAENTLTYNKIWGLTEDNNGNIWLGTDGYGVNIWHPEKGVIKIHKHDPTDAGSISDDAILSALNDYKGDIWLGTYAGGINRYDFKTGRFHHYKAPDEIPANDIRVIYEDPYQTLWVGMNQGGLARYNRKSDQFERIIQVGMRDIRSLFHDGTYLWLGMFGQGIFRYEPNSGIALEYGQLFGAHENKISPGAILSMYGYDNILWIATTDQGLCRMDTKTGDLTYFTEENGLPNNTIHSILPDDDGNLWLSTNKGISKFNIKAEFFTNFNYQHGVQPEEFHDGSGLITKSGLFCFGGNKGLNYFHPKQIKTTTTYEKIRFTSLKLLNQEIFPGHQNIIDKSIEHQPIINLRNNHRVISLEFKAISYPFSTFDQFEYILEGYDKSWNVIMGQNTATYRNLPPGSYLFRIRTHSQHADENISEISLIINMATPIWKTKGAYLFYFLFFLSIFYIALRVKFNQYKMRNQLSLERELRQKEKRMHEERLEFFTNISHELRTPLAIIGVALEDIAKFKQGAPSIHKSIEAAVGNSNRLTSLVNKLLQFRQVETGLSDLTIESINLNQYLTNFLPGFRELAKQKKINLKLTLPINTITLWADQEKLSMMLNNLLSNAFNHTKEEGIILINADEIGNSIHISVEDNGTGIPKNQQNDIFKRYVKLDAGSTGSGIGLALTKSLIELHHGEISVVSTAGQGACFTLKFAKGNNHYTSEQLTYIDNPPVLKEKTSVDENEEMQIVSHKRLLLLVDDNKELQELLHSKFKDEYRVIKAYDGAEGIRMAQKHCPDIIVMDIMMPELNGTEACLQLKSNPLTSHIPIILLTAKGTIEDEIAGLNTNADDYISKPFNLSLLKARIKTHIENRKLLFNHFTSTRDEIIPHSTKEQTEMEFLSKLETYILDNCLDSDMSVFELAAEMGFSRTTLYRKMKALTGMSINAFVRSVKIKKSAILISNGMNVSEAAFQTGFNDLKYFRECFKKQFGKSPSEYK